MENKQSENIITSNKIVFTDISLNNVSTDYKRTYTRNRGTLGQLVYSLDDMIDRLNEPSNAYQNTLYPKIQGECKLSVSEYNRLLDTIQSDDYYVAGYYLNGSRNNGKRKPTTSYYEKKSYGVSEYKETLKSINDRLRHIKYDCLRKCRDTTRTNQEVFQRLVVFCDEYHKVINERLEAWGEFITELRNTNGIVKKVKVKKNTHKSNTRRKTTHKIRVRRKRKNTYNYSSSNDEDSNSDYKSSRSYNEEDRRNEPWYRHQEEEALRDKD